jgi:hypothetical protein
MSKTPKQYCQARGIDYRVYSAWVDMRRRCTNPKCKDYKNYGARGITWAPEWNFFACFAEDMGVHPGKGWTLERVNNNEGYSRDNCIWATRATQARNRRRTKLDVETVVEIRHQYKLGGVSYMDLAREYGACKASIADVVKYRWWR